MKNTIDLQSVDLWLDETTLCAHVGRAAAALEKLREWQAQQSQPDKQISFELKAL